MINRETSIQNTAKENPYLLEIKIKISQILTGR